MKASNYKHGESKVEYKFWEGKPNQIKLNQTKGIQMTNEQHYEKMKHDIEGCDEIIESATQDIDKMLNDMENSDPRELFMAIETRGYAQGRRSILIDAACGYEKQVGIVGIGHQAKAEQERKFQGAKMELLKELGVTSELRDMLESTLSPKSEQKQSEVDDKELQKLKDMIPDLPTGTKVEA